MTNVDVRSRIQNASGVYGDLVTMAKKNGNLDGISTSQDLLAICRGQ